MRRGGGIRGRRGAAATAFALVAALVLGLPGSAGASDRAFSIRFQTNDTGDITIAANTLMTCPAAALTCAAAQNGTATGGNNNNNNYVMGYVDVDADATTFDSSTADLVLPSRARVLFAGLYWGADISAGAGGAGAPDPASKGTVLFAAPGGGYATVAASQVDTSTAQPGRYQGFADVTGTVQASGAGTYGMADVQAGTGNDRYAGWALVVAYHDPTLPARNLTVFDGFQTVTSGGPSVDIPVSGFLTPTSGPVRTTLGFVTHEGDLGLLGDSASLDATPLTDAAHPATNFFDSAISTFGSNVTTRSPAYVNQLGFDADLIDADGILANGATSATIHLTTNNDTYFPGVVTFATDLFAPSVLPSKSAVDLNGGPVQPGDVIEYHVTGTNTGQDGATNLTVTDPIPASTTYVSGSLDIVSSPGGIAGPKTDAPGDDQAEVAGGNVVFRVGTGADATDGGTLEPGQSFEVSFRVRVAAGTPAGTTIRNQATDSMDAETTPGLHLEQESDPVVLTVAAPTVLQLTKRASPTSLTAGGDVRFTLTLNVSGAAAATTVSVCDTLPGHMTFVSAPGATIAGAQACWSFASLPVGASRTLTVVAKVDADAPTGVERNVAVAQASNADPVRATAAVSVRAAAPGGPIPVTG
ncbi:MAG TPA: hypothetical protein VGH10_09840 [Actinomycetota bacterium]